MQMIKVKKQNILLLSDTHGKHRLIDVPKNIDIVIHCGDICEAGDMDEIFDFFEWYAALEVPYKIFVHGNHDLPFEMVPEWGESLIPENVIWLNDASIAISDINIMGISAFPFYKGIEAKNNIDIIASHYPPFGILDDGFGSQEIGECIAYLKPKYHVFGHNHAGYGQIKPKNTQYINASIYHQLCQKENQ